ncbi:tumor necrosis factor ligand superfamily member 12-like [Bubalus kerabau]|uniref:tumor necrosis factor ligand superfamily member 12-like n=1 Tax=Bubalus carabanensis TaxID=3119969 RepID=UPI00244EE772|nr:tumor necrosis factor ligand superfamily member 12-like [Bubalus carabanensis]
MLQTWRERREEPGTALLALLMLGLGLLLALVSLGSWASLFAQDLNPQPEESQDAVPFPKLVCFAEMHLKARNHGRTEQLQPTMKFAHDQDKMEHRQHVLGVCSEQAQLQGLGCEGFPPVSEHPHSGVDGTVSGWEEAKINSSNPLRYDCQTGQFMVTRAGLYYLYCQVHFDEGKAVYLKLDLLVDDTLALRCLEEFSATAASSPGPQLRLCQVSGLLRLRRGSSLRIRTLPQTQLKAAPFLTYFGLFQVH